MLHSSTITAYDIVEDDSVASLVIRINDHIRDGWQPVGGFRQYRNQTTNVLNVSQTIVKYDTQPIASPRNLR